EGPDRRSQGHLPQQNQEPRILESLMPKFKRTILITGGAGFIGSHAVRRFVRNYPDYRVVNYDLLTYAGNLSNLDDLAGAPNYVFEKGDIGDSARVQALFHAYDFDAVIHLAAE